MNYVHGKFFSGQVSVKLIAYLSPNGQISYIFHELIDLNNEIRNSKNKMYLVHDHKQVFK